MKATEIVAIVKKGLTDCEYGIYGLRADRDGIEVGDSFENSHQWYQDDPADWGEECEYNEDMGLWDGGELDGTCTIGLPDYECDWDNEVADALKRVQMYGKNIYLVAGDNAGQGNDIGEVLIANAVCVAKI